MPLLYSPPPQTILYYSRESVSHNSHLALTGVTVFDSVQLAVGLSWQGREGLPTCSAPAGLHVACLRG